MRELLNSFTKLINEEFNTIFISGRHSTLMKQFEMKLKEYKLLIALNSRPFTLQNRMKYLGFDEVDFSSIFNGTADI